MKNDIDLYFTHTQKLIELILNEDIRPTIMISMEEFTAEKAFIK